MKILFHENTKIIKRKLQSTNLSEFFVMLDKNLKITFQN